MSVNFSDMTAFCLAESNRIESTQKALVEAGIRTEPAPEKTRDIEVLTAMLHMIGFIRSDQIIIDRLKKIMAKAKAEAAQPTEEDDKGSEVSNSVSGDGAE